MADEEGILTRMEARVEVAGRTKWLSLRTEELAALCAECRRLRAELERLKAVEIPLGIPSGYRYMRLQRRADGFEEDQVSVDGEAWVALQDALGKQTQGEVDVEGRRQWIVEASDARRGHPLQIVMHEWRPFETLDPKGEPNDDEDRE